MLSDLLKRKAAGANIHVIAASRTPEKLSEFAKSGAEVRSADFDKVDTLTAAFKGVHRLVLVSTAELSARLQQHKNAIQAAEAANVQWVGYTSFIDAAPNDFLGASHYFTEVALASSTKLKWTLFRVNLYAEYAATPVPGLDTIFHASGNGGRAVIARADVALLVSAATVNAEKHYNRLLWVSGSEALTNDQIAQLYTEILKRPIKAVNLTLEQYKANLIAAGLPAPVAEGYASFEPAAANGRLAIISDDFETIVGHKPTSLKDFILSQQK